MRIAVVGAGAIGGMLGVRLAGCGHQVSLIARGAHLAAIRERGLELVMSDATRHHGAGLLATDRMAACGPQDLVILALKAHQIEPVIGEIGTLLGPDTVVLSVQNGIPWWYFQRHGGPHEGTVLRSVDPEGAISAAIAPERILGCVAYPAAVIERPGVIRHIEGLRFPLGELDGGASERATRISEALVAAGFKAPVLEAIRAEIWLKAWGNLSFNPISALTHATLVDICQFGPSRELAAEMMREAQEVAERLGITFRVPLEKRIAGAERVGRHKTSMLQDVEAGKALEADALIGAVVELGRITATPTPTIGAIYATVKLLNATLERERVRIEARPLAGAPAQLSATG